LKLVKFVVFTKKAEVGFDSACVNF